MRRVAVQAGIGWRHALCAVAVAVLLTAPAAADETAPASEREATILNRSPQPINEIYVSPQSADQWGTDWLGERTLAPGGFRRLHLGRTRECVFDVKIIYRDASREERRGVDLCRTHQLTFDASAATAAPGIGVAHSITLMNRSVRPIQQVFISPAEANQWGEDRIDQGSISVADRRAVSWQGGCNVDLRVVFDNRAAEERRGVDLCAISHLAIEPGWTTADTLPGSKVGTPP